MRRLLALALALVLAVALAVSAAAARDSDRRASAAASRTVKVGDNWFVSARSASPRVRVRRGTRVVFRFVGRAPHNVAVLRGPRRFTSPVKRRGTWSKRMTRAGRYVLYCEIHGADDQRMRLRVLR